MPTTITKTVKASGGDYTSLRAWESGEQANLVNLDQIRQAECYSFADTLDMSFGAWTTDATRYIRVYTPASERHNGTYQTTKYRLETSGTDPTMWVFTDGNFGRVEGIQIQYTRSATGSARGFVCSGGTWQFQTNIVKGVFSGTADPNAGIELNSVGGSLKVWNTIVYDFVNGTNLIRGLLGVGSGTFYASNVTVVNCRNCIEAFSGTFVAKNCIAQDGNIDYTGTFDGASTNNCADIANQAPGTNPQTGTVSFVDKVGRNLHLASGDTIAKDNGANLSADPNTAFSNDIDGQTRVAPWDIGADEIVGGAAATVRNPFGFCLMGIQ